MHTRTFIVRIYGWNSSEPRSATGFVETVPGGERLGFRDLAGLCEALLGALGQADPRHATERPAADPHPE